jgi:ribonuclease HII
MANPHNASSSGCHHDLPGDAAAFEAAADIAVDSFACSFDTLEGPPDDFLMKIDDSRIKPTFELEATELALGRHPIAGIDEAGRGPWAGPVVAAAVILDPDNIPTGIDDSKALDEDGREVIYHRIVESGAIISTGIAEVDRIDRDNILNATLWAMAEATRGLKEKPKLAIVDGNRAPRLACETRTIVKGDAKCLSIAAASIIAKVTRDRLMIAFDREHPGYGFARHKGYGTPEHKEALERLGVCALHRRSFRPIQLALGLVEEIA